MVIEFRRMNFQQDTTYKVVTIGAESVGKTSMTTRFIYNIFNQHQPSTVGANYQVFTRDIDGERVSFRIYIRQGNYHYVFEDGTEQDFDRYDDDDDDRRRGARGGEGAKVWLC